MRWKEPFTSSHERDRKEDRGAPIQFSMITDIMMTSLCQGRLFLHCVYLSWLHTVSHVWDRPANTRAASGTSGLLVAANFWDSLPDVWSQMCLIRHLINTLMSQSVTVICSELRIHAASSLKWMCHYWPLTRGYVRCFSCSCLIICIWRRGETKPFFFLTTHYHLFSQLIT